MDMREEKSRTRTAILKNLQALSPEQRRRKSTLASERLISCLKEIMGRFDTILSFLSMGSEIDTAGVNRWAREHAIRTAFPRIEGKAKEMVFRVADPADESLFELHPYGFLQPKGSQREVGTDHAVIIVPGMGFTPDHRRLGRGGGYYDRYLSQHGTAVLTVGFCFSEQLIDELPVEEHDWIVDMILTDSGTF